LRSFAAGGRHRDVRRHRHGTGQGRVCGGARELPPLASAGSRTQGPTAELPASTGTRRSNGLCCEHKSRLAADSGGTARIACPSAGMQPRVSRTARVCIIAGWDIWAALPLRSTGWPKRKRTCPQRWWRTVARDSGPRRRACFARRLRCSRRRSPSRRRVRGLPPCGDRGNERGLKVAGVEDGRQFGQLPGRRGQARHPEPGWCVGGDQPIHRHPRARLVQLIVRGTDRACQVVASGSAASLQSSALTLLGHSALSAACESLPGPSFLRPTSETSQSCGLSRYTCNGRSHAGASTIHSSGPRASTRTSWSARNRCGCSGMGPRG